MDSDSLPPETFRFIRAYFDSVGKLEVLLLLRAAGEEALTAARIDEKQRSSLAFVEQAMASLVSHGLASVAEGGEPKAFKYSPSSHDLARAVDQLAELYAKYPVRVITAIYSAADPLQGFADAFRIRKEPDSNG